MKKSKKMLCGAMAGVALFTGMGILSGCDITKDKGAKVNYQAKIDTILKDWSNKNSHLINFSGENQELNTVHSREDDNFNTSSLDLFIKSGVDLNDVEDFIVFGGRHGDEGVDNNTWQYADVSVDLLDELGVIDLKLGDIKLNQYYKLKDYDMYFTINVDNEKLRYVYTSYEGLNEYDISVCDFYYDNDSVIKMTEMEYSFYSPGPFGVDVTSYQYYEYLPSSNPLKRAFDGMVKIEDSFGNFRYNDELKRITDMEIYSELDGIYYTRDEFTFEVQKLMLEVRENINSNLLTLEELRNLNAIEFEVNY